METTNTVIVKGKDGLRGVVDVGNYPLDGSVPQALVQLDNGQQVWVPYDMFVQQEDGSYYLPVSLTVIDAQQRTREGRQPGDTIVLPVIEEEVEIHKRPVKTGVRVTKKIHEREEVIDEPVYGERVEVERIPRNQILDRPASVRYEGDAMIIPVMEEILVVEKRLLLKEEVRIAKRRETIREAQKVTLRREEAVVQQLPVEVGG